MTIPKLIHRIWFGQNPTPPAYEDYWLAWQRQHPDYTFKIWRDSDIDESFLTRRKVAEAQGMSRKADIASYEILHKQGGIYLDCDVMPFHYLDWQKLDADVVVCNEVESEEFCSHAVMAAAPANEIFRRATVTLSEMPLNVQPPNVETGPFFFRRMLAFGPYKALRKEAFYPYDSNEPFASILLRDLANTYGIHVWKGSWIAEKEMILNILDRLRWGDLSEAVSLASEVSAEFRKMVMDYVEVVSKARTACLVATNHAILSKYLKIKSKSPFEFLKCAFYLLEKEKDATIWQVGAADGILADPLRPLAINCDPRIVMLEPNPPMFDRLKQNYANNKNITFIQSALAATSGKRELHSISPDKVSVNQLPEWVAGISWCQTDRNAMAGLNIVEDLARRTQEHVEKIPVEVMSVAAVLAASPGQKPEVVLIDAGGMDGEIVQAILASGIRPKIIQYETRCLPQPEQDALTTQLGKDYVHVSFGNDLVAYRTDFFLAYCNDLYIKNGISTIYEDALKCILRN